MDGMVGMVERNSKPHKPALKGAFDKKKTCKTKDPDDKVRI